MGELVKRDEKDAPLFGRDMLEGIGLTKSESGSERTLRNAIITAISAESEGDNAKAYAIWTHKLSTGETIWQAVCNALPHHVAYLGGREAGFTWTKDAVQVRINDISSSLGSRPALAHWDSGKIHTCLWEWPDSKAWLAVEFNTAEMGRPMQVRPKSPHASSTRERMGIDCEAPHTVNELGEKVTEPHTLAECHEPTFADKMDVSNDWDKYDEEEERQRSDAYVDPAKDATYAPKPDQAIGTTYGPDMPGPRLADNVLSVPGTDSNGSGEPLWIDASDVQILRVVAAQNQGDNCQLTAPEVKFLVAVDTRIGKAQRKSKSYRPCEICMKVVSCGQSYVTLTGRRRVHMACARKGQLFVSELIYRAAYARKEEVAT